jgi:hypothetical protein
MVAFADKGAVVVRCDPRALATGTDDPLADDSAVVQAIEPDALRRQGVESLKAGADAPTSAPSRSLSLVNPN